MELPEGLCVDVAHLGEEVHLEGPPEDVDRLTAGSEEAPQEVPEEEASQLVEGPPGVVHLVQEAEEGAKILIWDTQRMAGVQDDTQYPLGGLQN